MNKNEFVAGLKQTAQKLDANSLIMKGKAIAYQEIANMLEKENIEFVVTETKEPVKEEIE